MKQINVIFGIIFLLSVSFSSALTYVDSCQVLSISNEIYILNQTINSASTCFNITASNVTFNGNRTSGFFLNGTNVSNRYELGVNNTFGIQSNNTYTTIINFNITNWGTGIFLNKSHNTKLVNISVSGTASNSTQTYSWGSHNLTLISVDSIGTFSTATSLVNVKGFRLFNGLNLNVTGNARGGMYILNFTNVLFNNYNNTVDRLAVSNVTNLRIINSTYRASLALALNTVNNVSIQGLTVGTYKVSSTGMTATFTNNFNLADSFIYGPTNGVALNYVSGTNISINKSTIYGFNGNAQGLILGASTSNSLVENSNLSIDSGNSGQGGLIIQGQNATIRNTISRVGTGNAQYIVSITATAKNVIISNATIQEWGRITSSTGQDVNGILLGGTNITIQDSYLNMSFSSNGYNYTNLIKFVAGATNINLINIRTTANSTYNFSRAILPISGLRNITIINFTAHVGGPTLGTNITNVSNLVIINSMLNSSIKSNFTINLTNFNISNSYVNGYRNTIFYRGVNNTVYRNNVSWNTA